VLNTFTVLAADQSPVFDNNTFTVKVLSCRLTVNRRLITRTGNVFLNRSPITDHPHRERVFQLDTVNRQPSPATCCCCARRNDDARGRRQHYLMLEFTTCLRRAARTLPPALQYMALTPYVSDYILVFGSVGRPVFRRH
jgi:hypothetical protein